MTPFSRRALIAGASASALSACAGGTRQPGRFKIDQEVTLTLSAMQTELPFTADLVQRAAGLLVMPRVSKAGFLVGGTYGEGSLLIDNAPVDYYSVVAASFGLQAGVQQYSSCLFFMSKDRLKQFRGRAGWTLGADLEYTLLDQAGAAGIDTDTLASEVYALVFNQAGLLVGASIEGSKYSRIVR